MDSDKTPENAPMPPEENQINESYWPTLRKILEEDPSGMDRLSLECMMCKSPMSTKENEHVKDENGGDHRAIILLCGHLIGFSCLADHLMYRKTHGLPPGCPLNTCKPSFHPVCGCFFMGWPFPEKAEDVGVCKRTASEGLKLKPKCYTCTSDDVLQSLTLLTGALEGKMLEDLESFKLAYRIQIKNKIYGAFDGDEREKSSLATLYYCPSPSIGEGDFKVRLFEYSGPIEMIAVD
ncbi:uncharacterized protein NECHADRAFT_76393 [Fusarium vanettenii 77-13-4]|uniref:RING-type domain-containing protein n=1 Tax=Fusarium vanettenii (strain ATCC MYA-4622 / CBS 123669 / FGSC 9596 / NRRL 45880 / 77-13-4) TaxID=660122 RepID=C7Z7D2_FUSV7|nr:uncharacterized protein NECHADRAFT_76393 [Fusarium vanettenii 77-13-4]EEU40282.1 hypothetical protein NECHADRAFT_76393 [Fusarium vanettenii 77-13-4]